MTLIDDQGYGDMGYANTFDALAQCTPFMDGLAKDGIKLRTLLAVAASESLSRFTAST